MITQKTRGFIPLPATKKVQFTPLATRRSFKPSQNTSLAASSQSFVSVNWNKSKKWTNRESQLKVFESRRKYTTKQRPLPFDERTNAIQNQTFKYPRDRYKKNIISKALTDRRQIGEVKRGLRYNKRQYDKMLLRKSLFDYHRSQIPTVKQ